MKIGKENLSNKEFNELAENRNLYLILKPLSGELSYAKVGDKYYSDTLYERGYNINELVLSGVLKMINEPFYWQQKLVGKNEHTVYSYCPNCQAFGVNMPLDNKCGSCEHPRTITYYDAFTINNMLLFPNSL